MNKFFTFLNSNIGRKWLMALTGLFLCLFVLVHMSGNLQLFKDDNGQSFNEYSVFMTTFPPVKAISYINYAMILIHAVNGFWLIARNKKARPIKYAAAKDGRGASWASKNMGLLGTILLVFIVIHMGNFWRKFHWFPLEVAHYETDMATGQTTFTTLPGEAFAGPKHYFENGNEIFEGKNLYKEVEEDFKNPIYSIFYVISMVALAYHLFHGFQSAFQTLGIRRQPYEKIIRGTGNILFAVIIPAMFAAMPIYFLLIHK